MLGHSWGQQGQPGGGMLLAFTTLPMHQQQLLQLLAQPVGVARHALLGCS